MKNNSRADLYDVCNLLVTLILTIVTGIIIYQIFGSAWAATLVSLVSFWVYAWIEEKWLSKYVNSIVGYVFKDNNTDNNVRGKK